MPFTASRCLVVLVSTLSLMGMPARPCPAQSAPQPSDTAEPGAPAWKLGGQFFADYYVVASHDPRWGAEAGGPDDLEGRQGFWLRRVYLTYDQTFTPRLSARIRLEANSAGDFLSPTRLEPFVKDAYVGWRVGRHTATVGLVPTASFQLTEQVWGLRSVEKTPLDLYRFDSSRDLGVLVTGPLGAEGRLRYEFQLGNGAGVSSETNDAKAVRGAISFETPRGLTTQAYVDHQARSDAGDWTTVKGLVAWRQPGWRVAGIYALQHRRAAWDGQALDLDLLSVFAVASLHERVDVFGRVDRVLDALPGAATIDYVPVPGDAAFSLWLAGVDIELEGPLRLQPHVEVVHRGATPERPSPAPTVIPRLTLALSW